MNTLACWIRPVWITICVLVVTGRAPGQTIDAASILYGHGVHAYFDSSASEAEQYLTRAIEVNPNDPRAHYFRALSRLRLGRDDEARNDLQAGAAAEARRPNRYAVGTSLQRVQGRERLLLEQYRRQAREQYAVLRDRQDRARYEQFTGREAEVLRHKITVPLDQLLPPGEAQSTRPSPPSAAPPKSAAASAGASDAPAAAKGSGDPFADDPQSSQPAASQPEKPSADELFGTPARDEDTPLNKGPDDSTSKPTDGAESEEDPFGPDEEDPFGF